MPGPLREAHRIVIKGPAAGEGLTRSWYKNPPRASQKSFHTSTFRTWHLQDLQARTSYKKWISTRSSVSLTRTCTGSCKDLLERNLSASKNLGSPQGLLRRTCARSCNQLRRCQPDLHKIFSEGPAQDHARTCGRISSGYLQHLLTRTSTRPRSRSSSITGASKMKLLQDRQTLASGRTKSGTLVLRACAVERHMEMPQEPFHECAQSSCEPAKSKRSWLCHKSGFMREFTNYKKNAGDQERDPQFVRACAIEMHTDKSQESFNLARECTKMMPPSKDASQTLCEPFLSSEMQSIAQASWTTHQQCSSELSHFRGIQVDPNHSDSKPRATMSSQWWRYLASQSRKGSCGNLVYRVVHFLVGGRMSIVELKIAMIGFRHRYFRSICASLRNRHAHGHVARENLQQKCRKPDGAPWSGTDLNSYRKNASVWTHCFGNDCHGW